MSAAVRPAAGEKGCPPALKIGLVGAAAVEFAVVPTLGFTLRIGAGGTAPIRGVALNAQIRIAVARRAYDPATRRRLGELLGPEGPHQRPAPSMLWAHAAVQVPPFDGETEVELHVPCTYDFEVAAAKYLHVLPDGEVPLEFLFTGTIFYLEDGLLQAALIPWDTDVDFPMPVAVWKDVMERYFPHSAWLRLDRETFDRLYAYKVRHALPGWDDVVASLLPGTREGL
ncbi:hypothetical protein Misp01_44050 [Microtetraspora sp. NBRC 13810]|uniref:DUF6084 family protein n=1 Tax=Microtetraspora sp. NBRC 13810 TaxID=3030990 RepID=UPI0024A444C8|nr:DUF6084 family protein [Microtetraspora sp. NBRC 13810]GLW09276.1 hypothetical protein Misp01_44050 [Microtetraspora sp. NBRC 13810]